MLGLVLPLLHLLDVLLRELGCKVIAHGLDGARSMIHFHLDDEANSIQHALTSPRGAIVLGHALPLVVEAFECLEILRACACVCVCVCVCVFEDEDTSRILARVLRYADR